MQPSPQALMSHPDYLLSAIDRHRFSFARVTETTYRQSAFLDHRMQPMPDEVFSMSSQAVRSGLSQLPGKPADLIIVHSSFCASTLLARTLDAEDVLVPREPQILGHLANLRRNRTDAADEYQQLFSSAMHLLTKRYADEQKLVLKLSNYANNLAADMMHISASTRLLIMLGSMEDLLISMHKHANEAAASLPRFLAALRIDDPDQCQDLHQVSEMSTMQQTALLWHLQLRQFMALNASFPDRTRLLLSNEFLSEPSAAVNALDAWIAAKRTEAERHAMLSSMLGMDAKGRGGEATTARTSSRDAMRVELADRIASVKDWAGGKGLLTDATELRSCRRLL
jgi:hypothetical protein